MRRIFKASAFLILALGMMMGVAAFANPSPPPYEKQITLEPGNEAEVAVCELHRLDRVNYGWKVTDGRSIQFWIEDSEEKNCEACWGRESSGTFTPTIIRPETYSFFFKNPSHYKTSIAVDYYVKGDEHCNYTPVG